MEFDSGLMQVPVWFNTITADTIPDFCHKYSITAAMSSPRVMLTFALGLGPIVKGSWFASFTGSLQTDALFDTSGTATSRISSLTGSTAETSRNALVWINWTTETIRPSGEDLRVFLAPPLHLVTRTSLVTPASLAQRRRERGPSGRKRLLPNRYQTSDCIHVAVASRHDCPARRQGRRRAATRRHRPHAPRSPASSAPACKRTT